MKITPVNYNQQSFGTLLNKEDVFEELVDFLGKIPKTEYIINLADISKLQKTMVEVEQAQTKNHDCYIDLFVSSRIPQVPKVPSINLGHHGIVTEQLNIKQAKYKGMNPVDAIIQMLKDASEFATKIKEA